MKRKLLSLAVIVALCVTMLPSAGWASENTGAIDEWQVPEAPAPTGSWTDEGNYNISWYTGAAAGTTNFELEDAADLAGLAAIVNGTATSNGKPVSDSFKDKTVTLKKDTDFDLSAHAWIPIKGFKGTFDGNKDKDTAIKKMVVNLQGESGGLFSYGMAGTIKNVSVKEAYIQTTSDAGGIVARSTAGSTIKNCSFDGIIVANGKAGPSATTAGGIVGKNVGAVQNCTVRGSISGTSGNMGGIVGFNGSTSSGSNATVIDCKNNAQIAGNGSTGYSHDGAGGIAGQSSGIVEDCTNNGMITGQGPNIGGIVGLMCVADDQAVVESCTNAGIVNAHADYLGGIVGAVYVDSQNVDERKILACSNTAAITAQADVDGLTSTTGGVLGGVLDYKDTKITIQQCKNMGAVSAGYSFNNSYGVGGIVGDVGNDASLSVKETFNSGTVTATDMSSDYVEHHSKNIGVGGLIGRASDEDASVEIENAYNVGNVSSGEMTLQVGGIVGIWHNDAHKKISAVYNAGLLEGAGSKGSIIGNGENAALTNVSYWSGCGGSGVGNSRTANQMTGENWATELGLSTEMWSKSENAEDGTGYLPVLKNNQQNPAPTLTRTAKQDQAALSISAEGGVFTDDTNRVIRENHAPFTLIASGGTKNQPIHWTISQGDDIVTIDQNGRVTLTNKAFGNVSITATMPGDGTYNDVSTSFTFSVKPLDIAKATIYDLHAPVAGVSPVMSAGVPEDAHYEGMVAADFGSGMTGVQWKDAEENFLSEKDAFKQGAKYTAIIRLKADDLYDWAENVSITIGGIQPAAIEQVSSVVDEEFANNLIITVVFKPTSHVHNWSSEWSSDGLYHWHACLNDDCTETASGSDGYAIHTDANNDGKCDICTAEIGYVITFDANGGDCSTASVRTDLDGRIVALPEASRDGYTFRGWFTVASGGEQVNVDKVYSADTTLYAQWEKIPEPPYSGKYSHEIFSDDSEGGALDVDRYATEGEQVTITVLPDDGYALDEIVITDENGETIEFVDNGDGTITFTMPSGDVTITATFVESDEPECTLPFVDVHANDWFFDPVCYVYSEGLMTGTSATTFAPNATTTRAMIVSILARLENVASAEDAGFTDVAENDWYATAVNWAANNGIVAGFEDATFRPNDPITREQLAAILMNYAAYKGEDVSARAALDAYSDADAVSSWAAETMSWAVAEGYISGMTADKLQPQGNATRAQVAAIFQRYLEK